MQSLVFDIETIPVNFEETFDEVQMEYLMRGAANDEERELRKSWGGLNPFLGKIVCIGTYVHETKKGSALYLAQQESEEVVTLDDMTHKYKAFVDEAEMLRHFWDGVSRFDAFVSFNGRNFDSPFLMLRSAILGIRPSVNFMAGTRWEFKVGGSSRDKYGGVEHIDLADKLCFGQGFDKAGATRKFNLDFYTKAFGIPSPKSAGIAGDKVPHFFAEGKSREIAEYCMRDVRATSDLYAKWVDLLKF